MEAFKQLCFRMEDIRQNRLDRVLNSLRCYALCPAPRDATWMPEEFIDVIRDSCKNVMAVSSLERHIYRKSIEWHSLVQVLVKECGLDSGQTT